MQQTTSERQRLRTLGQANLGDWIEVSTGKTLWSVQKQIARAISKPKAHVAVPSCNSSGKTHLAARIALAFYDAYFPGTPCVQCGGPCRGAKIITTSSKWEHLRDNLWGELRSVYPAISRRVGMDGRLFDGDLRMEAAPNHFIIGQSAASAEGMQGYHQAHKLIIGDEATAVKQEVSQGITGLLASGDARLLLIFNPTTPDTYAYAQATSARTETIKITAWDTPNFTGEEVPDGANLVNQDFLDDLEAQGMGPGTYEWTTRVEANFWNLGDAALINEDDLDRLWVPGPQDGSQFGGTKQLGVDMASYGTDENVIAVREGNELIDLRAYPSMRQDVFWRTHVLDVVRLHGPHYVCYDADGVGAGVIGYADEVQAQMVGGGSMLPFRGAKSVNDQTTNARGAWWWHLRRRFESGQISLRLPHDPKLRSQLLQMQYSIQNGKIRAITKEEMRKQGFDSPDRADSVMYAFAMSDNLQVPTVKPSATPYADTMAPANHSERHMWEGVGAGYAGRKRRATNPQLGISDF